MITVLVNGRKAAIKENSSFDLVSENPLFTDSELYTLNIVFPLKGCRENIEIFGHVNRHGHGADGRPFDMVIISGDQRFEGVGTLTSVTDIECKVQFLAGKSSQNYYSELSDIYVNTLDLGELPAEYRSPSRVSVATAWAGHRLGLDFVAIPYVNEGTGHIVNNTESDGSSIVAKHAGDGQEWKLPEEAKDDPSYVMQLSWMPYLIFIAKKICAAIGYSCDFSKWEASKWNDLLMCHAVPATWTFKWNVLLPHWSVPEFFDKLEPLIEGNFVFDQLRQSVTFVPYTEVAGGSGTVVVDHVLDEFSSDVFEEEDECKLFSERYAGYAEYDSKTGRAYSCPWLIRDYNKINKRITEFETPEAISQKAKAENWNNYRAYAHNNRENYWEGECNHIRSVDRYVSNRVVMANIPTYIIPGGIVLSTTAVLRVPVMINQFGPRNIPQRDEGKDSPDLKIEYVPALIDDTDLRRMVFMPLSDYEEKHTEPLVDLDNSPINEAIYDSATMNTLMAGEDDGSTAYFSNVMVGFFPSGDACLRWRNEIFPIIDIVDFNWKWEPWYAPDPKYTLSLQDSQGKFAGVPKVNRFTRFEFSFISDALPDVSSMFMIRGHRYLCEKLTASFSEYGMSQKIKGVFWRLS